jgi:23S rRNA (cytidine1920-2'-O)/16S rRNA (cytidine1409-2'-O)-methyltransferase
MAGLVFSETRRLDKAGQQVAADLPLEVRGQDHPWVSRGGLKLDHALDRYLSAESLGEVPGFVCCDASFIGLRTVLPAALDLAASGAYLAALIKPQFEVGRTEVGKGGIVTDHRLHDRVVDEISGWLADIIGWRVLGTTTSPITGAGGNKEFLIVAQKPGS